MASSSAIATSAALAGSACAPCPHLDAFCDLIPSKFGLEVVVGTHPIPENYYLTHQHLGTWRSDKWQSLIQEVLPGQAMRLAYD